MDRRGIELLLNDAVQISKARYCDGGLRFQLLNLTQESDINDQCSKAYKEFSSGAHELKRVSLVSQNEFRETLEEFLVKLFKKKKGKIFSQDLLNMINTKFAPFVPRIWEADFQGHGYALVIVIESEQGNTLLLMEWTID